MPNTLIRGSSCTLYYNNITNSPTKNTKNHYQSQKKKYKSLWSKINYWQADYKIYSAVNETKSTSPLIYHNNSFKNISCYEDIGICDNYSVISLLNNDNVDNSLNCEGLTEIQSNCNIYSYTFLAKKYKIGDGIIEYSDISDVYNEAVNIIRYAKIQNIITNIPSTSQIDNGIIVDSTPLNKINESLIEILKKLDKNYNSNEISDNTIIKTRDLNTLCDNVNSYLADCVCYTNCISYSICYCYGNCYYY